MEKTNPMSQEEWDGLQTTLPRGSRVTGRVVSVHPFGVFVDIGLDPRIPVLLEIIHFKVVQNQPRLGISSADFYPAVGDEIEARILAYCMSPMTSGLPNSVTWNGFTVNG
jgi:ribosomal protein S1